jgi:site-specific recombinase XerD
MQSDLEAREAGLPSALGETADESRNTVLRAPERLREQAEAAQSFAKAQYAPATLSAYAADFRAFEDWCRLHALKVIPALPGTVATFLAFEAQRGVKVATITRRAAAIRYAHAVARLEPPTSAEVVKATLRGIRRSLGVASSRKAPATVERVLDMVRAVPDGAAGLRDRALLLLGFAGAFRRSELTALNVADLEFRSEGLRVTICRSKTDQEGVGQVVAIVRGHKACPVAAVEAWLASAQITYGPVFRPVSKSGQVLAGRLTPHSIALIVKRHAAVAGFDPALFSGHSLRAGFLTSAAARGASLFKLMDVSRHRSADTLRIYIREAEAFKDHAGAGLL